MTSYNWQTDVCVDLNMFTTEYDVRKTRMLMNQKT